MYGPALYTVWILSGTLIVLPIMSVTLRASAGALHVKRSSAKQTKVACHPDFLTGKDIPAIGLGVFIMLIHRNALYMDVYKHWLCQAVANARESSPSRCQEDRREAFGQGAHGVSLILKGVLSYAVAEMVTWNRVGL